MFECPHCFKLGITTYSKWRGGQVVPAKCNFCNQFSSVSGMINGFSGGFDHLCMYVALIWAFVEWSVIPLFTMALLVILVDLLILRFAPLVPYTSKQIRRFRKNAVIMIFVFIILVILAGVFS